MILGESKVSALFLFIDNGGIPVGGCNRSIGSTHSIMESATFFSIFGEVWW